MSNVTLTLQGETLTITVPDDVRAQLRLEPGQEMTVTLDQGGMRLVRIDAELDRQLAMVDGVLADHAETLRALASR